MVLLCSPVLVPQITGGVTPPGLVTANESIKHWPCSVAGLPAATFWVAAPLRTKLDVAVAVEGPFTMNMLKSNRS